LTVTDKGSLQAVGITLALEGKRLMFDVNLEHCERASLKPKPTLLELARSVRKATDGEIKTLPAGR